MFGRRDLSKRNGGVSGGKDCYVPISGREFPAEPHESRSILRIALFGCFVLVAALAAVVAGLSAYNAVRPVRAGCDVIIDFSHSCREVRTEISKRINGQSSLWHDPHNNGTYSFYGDQTTEKSNFERISGSGSKVKYTDSIEFNFISSSNNQNCQVAATSASQVFSILDFGTNFCNINNLYCSEEACQPFRSLNYSYKVGKCTDATINSCYTV